MAEHGLRVVKVGGSLLEYDRFVPALRAWLGDQPSRTTVLMAGGGTMADAIRAADRRFRLGEAASHRLCIEVLRVTARMLAALLPEMPLERRLGSLSRIQETDSGRAVIFCPAAFLRADAAGRHGTALPLSWDVTADSIASRLAEVVGAEELVLLKSSDPPEEAIGQAGYVDKFFEVASRRVPSVRLVNLRMYGCGRSRPSP